MRAGTCLRQADEDAGAAHPLGRLRPDIVVVLWKPEVSRLQDWKASPALIDATVPASRDGDAKAVTGDGDAKGLTGGLVRLSGGRMTNCKGANCRDGQKGQNPSRVH